MLTDFSENANHAAKAIAKIAPRLQAAILLYHTYYNHPMLTSYAGGPGVVEDLIFRKNDSTAQLSQLAVQLRHIQQETGSNDAVATEITFQCGEGSLGKNAAEIVRENQVDLVVMGSRNDDDLSHLIFGSDTMAVIQHAPCPVLIIPPGTEIDQLKKVIFAARFELADINAIHFLAGLSEKLDVPLEIVHVSLSQQKDDPVKEAALLTHIHTLKQGAMKYVHLRGRDVVKRLFRLGKSDRPAMLAMAHHHTGSFTSLFIRSHTNVALDQLPLLLLVIPAEWVAANGELTSYPVQEQADGGE